MGTGLEFGEIYEAFYETLNCYVGRIVGPNNAEDVTQEVFLKIDKALKDFKGQSSLSTWIYRIATNTALDKIKSRSYQEGKDTLSLEAMGSESGHGCVEEKSLSAEREAVRREMNDCIQEFVDRLPTDYRVVILLSEMKALKNQQIADVLGISLDAVKIRLHRARTRLKAEFEAGCDFYHDEDGKLACDRKRKSQNEE